MSTLLGPTAASRTGCYQDAEHMACRRNWEFSKVGAAFGQWKLASRFSLPSHVIHRDLAILQIPVAVELDMAGHALEAGLGHCIDQRKAVRASGALEPVDDRVDGVVGVGRIALTLGAEFLLVPLLEVLPSGHL